MDNLFDRAKEIGGNCIMQWLPAGGVHQGNELKMLNPVRPDDLHIGSFSVNLKTFAWADFSQDGDAQGNDAISLYAYLNRDRLETQARHDGYKNINAAIQTVAAKEILTNYDSSYFPNSSDDFNPKPTFVDPKDKWDGYRYLDYKIKDVPNIDFNKYSTWGSFVESWDFFDKNRLQFKVARFIQGKKKTDIPFTLWVKSSEIKWRPKAPQELYQLWNINAVIDDKENKEVILTEGQKDASRYVEDKYIAIGWYGGAGNSSKSDWSKLIGRTVIFFPDGDTAGRKAISDIRKYAEQYDFKLTIAKTPSNVSKGYGLADAIAEGRDLEEIIHPKDAKSESTDYGFLDDDNAPYTILGTSGCDTIFYVHASHRIEKSNGKSLTKNFLMVLASVDYWGIYFAKDGGGILWENAINYVLRKSDESQVFNFERVRGVGVWKDGDDIVINTGRYLLINGEKKQLHERVGEYVYSKSSFIPYSYDNPLSIKESSIALNWLKNIRWTTKVAPYALAGWVTLGPFGGVLRWRSMCWLVGCSGSGKSTLIEKFLHPMIIDEFGVRGDGLSTPAGVRQNLADSSKPYVGDEMESDNPKYADSIDQILKMFRSSSSGLEGAATLIGTQDGAGQKFAIQSMACFASIGAAIKHGADANRFTICELATPEKNEQRKLEWKRTEKIARTFTHEYARKFHARTYRNIKEVLKCIDVFRDEVSELLDSMRDGDQLGSLLAGAYMIEHDIAATNEEARIWLNNLDIQGTCSNTRKTDEELCFDEMLSSTIEVSNKFGRQNLTLGSCIEFLKIIREKADLGPDDETPAITQESLTLALSMNGYRLKEENGAYYLWVANNRKAIKKALRNTGWYTFYTDLLLRMKNVRKAKYPTSFGGIQSRYIIIKLDDEIPF